MAHKGQMGAALNSQEMSPEARKRYRRQRRKENIATKSQNGPITSTKADGTQTVTPNPFKEKGLKQEADKLTARTKPTRTVSTPFTTPAPHTPNQIFSRDPRRNPATIKFVVGTEISARMGNRTVRLKITDRTTGLLTISNLRSTWQTEIRTANGQEYCQPLHGTNTDHIVFYPTLNRKIC